MHYAATDNTSLEGQLPHTPQQSPDLAKWRLDCRSQPCGSSVPDGQLSYSQALATLCVPSASQARCLPSLSASS